MSVDAAAAADAVRRFLVAVGEDPDRPGLAQAQVRVPEAAVELFSGVGVDAADVLARAASVLEAASGPVAIRDIPFRSLCEHHLLPFRGAVSIAYLPGASVAGLGTLVRCVEAASSRPQVQERLTDEVADAVARGLGARGVLVTVTADQACLWARGTRAVGTAVTTLAARGAYAAGAARTEALALLGAAP